MDDLDAGLIEAARRAMVPVVVLSESAEAAPVARGYVSLTLPVSPATLASVLRAACEQARVTRESGRATRQLEELNAIGVRLSGERDTKLLLELILTKARTITRSDAGSIYLVESASDGSRRLRFELAHNESVPVEFNAVALPINPKSLAGHVALTGEVLHVDDAYALPADGPYRFNPEVDALAGYRTKSMLVLPMKTPGGEIIGVLELINGKRESGRPFATTAAIERDALPYSEAFRNLAESLASQAAVALANSNLFRELTRRQGRLEALVDVSQRVTRLWPPATVQRRIADLYAGLLQADVVAFHLVDEGRLVRAEARGEDVDVLLPAEIAVGDGPCGPRGRLRRAARHPGPGRSPGPRLRPARECRAWAAGLARGAGAGGRSPGRRPERGDRPGLHLLGGRRGGGHARSPRRPASRSRTHGCTRSSSARSRACRSPRTSWSRSSGSGRWARWRRASPTTSTTSSRSSCCAPSCCSRAGRRRTWPRA